MTKKKTLGTRIQQTFGGIFGGTVSAGTVVINGVVQGGGSTVAGSGTPKIERRTLPEFKKINNSILGDVMVEVDLTTRSVASQNQEPLGSYRNAAPEEVSELEPVFVAVVECDDNLLSLVQTEVRNDTLEISMKSGSFRPVLPVQVRIKTAVLTGIKHSGHGTFIAKNLATDRLTLDSSGMGHFEVHGTATEVSAYFSSHGDVVLRGFEDVDAMDLQHTGMGNVSATGTVRSLHATLNGHGDVNLKGLVTQHVNLNAGGMGDLFLNAKSVSGQHSGHGDVRLAHRRTEMKWNVSETGMGDVIFAR